MDGDPEGIDERLTKLEEAVRALEEWSGEYDKAYPLEYTAKLRGAARLRAAEEVIFELAEHCGIEKNRVIEHITQLGQRHLDHYLHQAQELGDGFAAEVDDRELGEVPTDEAIPRLFPPKDG